jgi:hypothetical protein
MKIKDAEKAAYSIWVNWPKKKESQNIILALEFYTHLEKTRPDVLKFRCSGDKYQTISGWVNKWLNQL